MKIAAIICEYNPFHKGHQYQIEQTRKITGCELVLCIMSPNFTQRAKGAIMDKYARAQVALDCGADIVVGMPTAFAVNNAEVFALCAVKMANSFKGITHLAFGMENPNIEALEEASEFFLNESVDYKYELKKQLNTGQSFNESRVKAFEALVKDNRVKLKHSYEILDFLKKPNNILALEYLKVLKSLNSKIIPCPIKRKGSEYGQQNMQGEFSSATAIRGQIEKLDLEGAKVALPKASFKAIAKYLKNNGIFNQKALEYLALYKLKTLDKKQIQNLYNVEEGLQNFLQNKALEANKVEDFWASIQTKRYKSSRLNSILLNAVLDINKSLVQRLYKVKKLPFIKVLAINKDKTEFLNKLQPTSKLILRKKDTLSLPKQGFTKELILLENRANAVYNLVLGKNILPASDLHSTIFNKTHK